MTRYSSSLYHKTPNGIVVDPNNWVLNKVGTITFGELFRLPSLLLPVLMKVVALNLTGLQKTV